MPVPLPLRSRAILLWVNGAGGCGTGRLRQDHPLEPVLKGHGRCRTGGWRAGGAARRLKAGPAQTARPAASPVGVVELFCPQRTVLDEKRKEKPQEGLRGWSAWPQALGSVGLFAVRVGQVSFHGGEPASQEEQKTVLLQGGGS